MRNIIIIIVLTAFSCAPTEAGWKGFSGACGFSVKVAKPDLSLINQQLKLIDMPELEDYLILYGGQGFGYITDRLAIGGEGYGGSMTVKDYQNGVAREASFSMGWGGILIEWE